MEGERSCQRVRGGQFNGGRIVMLCRCQFKEGRMVVIEVACLMEAE